MLEYSRTKSFVALRLCAMIILLAGFASCLGLDKCYAGQEPAKVAIIADGGLQNLSDLLSVELSKDAEICLLDRAALDKVFNEHKISLENYGGSPFELGKLVGADGLIIIKKFKFDGKELAVSRLVAVNSGVILGTSFQPLPVQNPSEWLQGSMVRFKPLLSKLNVPPKDTVRFSILNIRAPVDTPELKVLERELTQSLSFSLMQEKGIFVLERWKTDKLAWEKDLKTDEDNPFWTGSYLLDGGIEIAEKDTVQVKLRLRKPGADEIYLEESGKKGNLIELSEKIKAGLLKELGKEPQKIFWDTKAEADQYLKEAKWALENGLYEESIEAADAAKALGGASPEQAFTRIKASGGRLFKDLQFEEWNFMLGGRRTPSVEDPGKYIDALLYGTEINIFLFRQSENETLPFRRDSVSLLRMAAAVLHSACLKGLHKRPEYQDRLASLRRFAMDLFKLDASIKDNNKFANNQQYAYWLFFSYMGFLTDNGARMRNAFQEAANCADPARREMILECLRSRIRDVPVAVSWEGDLDAEAARHMVVDFISALINSKKDADKVNGLLLASTIPGLGPISGDVTEKTMELLWSKRDKISADGPTPEGYEVLANFASFQDLRENGDDADRYAGFLVKYLDYYMEEFRKGRKLDWKFLYWLSSGITSRRTPENSFLKINLALKGNYEDILARLEKFKSENQDLFLTSKDFYPNATYEEMKKIFKGTKESGGLYTYADKVEGRFISFADCCAKGDKPGNLKSFGTSGGAAYAIFDIRRNSASKSAEGQMLVEIKEDMSVKSHLLPDEAAVFGKASGPGQSQFNGSGIACGPDGRIFCINPGGQVWVYNPAGDRWKLFHKSDRLFKCALISGGHLYLAFGADDRQIDNLLNNMPGDNRKAEREKLSALKGTGSGIIRISLADGSEALFASSRRKPAQNPLDDRPSYSVNKIMEDPDGNIHVLIEKDYLKSFYVCNTASGEWRLEFKPDRTVSCLKNGAYAIRLRFNRGPGGSELQKIREIVRLSWDGASGDSVSAAKPVFSFKESGNSDMSFTGESAILEDGRFYTFWEHDYFGEFINHNNAPKYSNGVYLGIFSDKAERETVAPVALCSKDEDGWFIKADLDEVEMTEGFFWVPGRKYEVKDGKTAAIADGVWRIFKKDIADYLAGKLEAPTITGKTGATRIESLAEATPIEIVSSTSGAVLRYTVDGSNPDGKSPVYTGPITVKPGTTVKAKAFKDGHIPSDTTMKTFARE